MGSGGFLFGEVGRSKCRRSMDGCSATDFVRGPKRRGSKHVTVSWKQEVDAKIVEISKKNPRKGKNREVGIRYGVRSTV